MIELMYEHQFITVSIVFVTMLLGGFVSFCCCLPCALAGLDMLKNILTYKHVTIAIIIMFAMVPPIILVEKIDLLHSYPHLGSVFAYLSLGCIALINVGVFVFMVMKLPDGFTVWKHLADDSKETCRSIRNWLAKFSMERRGFFFIC